MCDLYLVSVPVEKQRHNFFASVLVLSRHSNDVFCNLDLFPELMT